MAGLQAPGVGSVNACPHPAAAAVTAADGRVEGATRYCRQVCERWLLQLTLGNLLGKGASNIVSTAVCTWGWHWLTARAQGFVVVLVILAILAAGVEVYSGDSSFTAVSQGLYG
jgi:hypothetical protein